MAIDPNISLQAGKIGQGLDLTTGVERGMKLQQLAMQPAILEQQLRTAQQQERSAQASEMGTRAQTELAQAQLPGVRAESTKRQREMVDFPEWMKQNLGQYWNPDTGTLDTGTFVEAATKAGYGKEALEHASKELGRQTEVYTTAQQKIKVARDETEAKKAQIETETAYNKLVNDNTAVLGNFLSGFPQSQQLTQLQNVAARLDQQFPDRKLGTTMLQMLTKTDPKTGAINIDPVAVEAAKASGRTAEQKEQLKLQYAQLAQNGALGYAQIASAERMHREPGAVVLMGAAKDNVTDTNFVTANNTAITLIDDINKKDPKLGYPGQVLDNFLQRGMNDPMYRELQPLVAEYNTRHPGAPIDLNMGLVAVKKALELDNIQLQSRVKMRNDIIGSKAVKPTETVAPKQSTGQSYRVGQRAEAEDGSIVRWDGNKWVKEKGSK